MRERRAIGLGIAAFVLGCSHADRTQVPAAAPTSSADRGAPSERLAEFFARTKGTERVIPASEVWKSIRSGADRYLVVDVRPAEEYANGHIPGALGIPIEVLFLPENLARLPVGGKRIVIVCQSGHVESMALGGLTALGYEPYAMRFGMIGWNAESHLKAGSPEQESDTVRGLGGPLER